MPREDSRRAVSQSRANRAIFLMGALESRTMLSFGPNTSAVLPAMVAAPKSADSSIVQSASSFKSSTKGTVIHIGPNQKYKTIMNAPWPKRGQTETFVLDYSSKPYFVQHGFVNGNLTIIPSSSGKRPTLSLPGNGKSAINVYGSLTIKGFNTKGGSNSLLLNSQPGSTIDCENITTDGGGIWIGSGGKSATFKNNEVHGLPARYVYANFNNKIGSVTIDHSGTSYAVPQGKTETAIRVMNVGNLTISHVKTKPYFKNGRIWKQDIQIRPESGHVKLINCTFYLPDVGDMTWRHPAKPIQYVEFINCTLSQMPHITAGVKTVKLTNCKVGGKTVSKTLH
jgi:hypothetical protein